MKRLLVAALVLTAVALPATAAEKINCLIIDGQNNHNWKATTPVLKQMLLATDRFTVDVVTSPAAKAPKEEWEKFRPDFGKYQVVLSNYNGEEWPAEVKAAFEKYMQEGGGLVVYHAANNAFTGWPAWAKMVGLLWAGPGYGERVTLDDEGKQVRTPKGEGPGAGHGPQWAYEMKVRDAEHPIMQGLPATWTHAKDELYHGQRGPGLDMHVLATAYSDKAHGGTGANELMVWTTLCGKGRVVVNLLGHDEKSVAHPGCATIMVRAAEWAATGKVTIPAPKELTAAK